MSIVVEALLIGLLVSCVGAVGGYIVCMGHGGPTPFRRLTGLTEQEEREIIVVADQWSQLPAELAGPAIAHALTEAARRGKNYGAGVRYHLALTREASRGMPPVNPALERLGTPPASRF